MYTRSVCIGNKAILAIAIEYSIAFYQYIFSSGNIHLPTACHTDTKLRVNCPVPETVISDKCIVADDIGHTAAYTQQRDGIRLHIGKQGIGHRHSG